MPALQRLYPAKEVQSLTMVAGGRNRGLAASLGPEPAELGMEGKAALISKDQQGFLTLLYDSVEFFFSPRRNRATPLLLAWM